MDDFTSHKNASPVLTEIPRFEGPPEPADARYQHPSPASRKIPTLNLALFLLTLLTTTMAGANDAGAEVSFAHPLLTLAMLPAGLSFSIPLMLILFAHEMGHYLTAWRYGVDATLPYFIPGPYFLFEMPAIGSFGAFIRMKSPPRTRRAMFDIGAAGPWAGFVIALVCIVIGLKLSRVTPLDTSQGGVQFGNSILFWGVSRVVLGLDPDSVNILLHPIAFAGWLGLFITTINLLPAGQLDGGHVVYSLLGPRGHRIVTRLALLGCLLMVAVPYLLSRDYWMGWGMWFLILLFLGVGHPATFDTDTPLIGSRRLAAWATILLFIVTFSPVPFSIEPPTGEPPSQGQTYSVIQRAPAHSPTLSNARALRL
jgi:membrane-associated protease RseP (regulator of RpoE activity)